MSNRVTMEVSPSTLRALLNYQAEQESELEVAEMADLAIRDWLQRQQVSSRQGGQAGYLWKTVFLPDGTRLRVKSSRGAHYAEVVCGEILYDQRCVSPNQFVSACLGNAGNAWKLVYVQLPGDSDWTQAQRLRYAAAAHALRTAKRKTERTAPPLA